MQTYFINPGGNPTVLVENLNNQIARSEYAKISKQLLENRKNCEQVGFIERGKSGNFRCQMMGDELCINGLRSLGFWVYSKFGKKSFELASSGTPDTFKIEAETWISIKLPKNYTQNKIERNLTLIEFRGIAHFVRQVSEIDKENSLKIFKELRNTYEAQLKKYPAIGLISINKNNEISPVVFVRATNSIILESACGSGTLAAFIAKEKKVNCFIQASGFPYIIQENKENFELKSVVAEFSKG